MGEGFGVIISKDGYVVINNYVVLGVKFVMVILLGKKEVLVIIVGIDVLSDIVFLKIDLKYVKVVVLFGDLLKVKVGEFVVVIGNFFG